MIYNIYYGIRNLIKWFPIIWRDRGWDWTYLVIMLQHKLGGIEKQLEIGNHTYWRKDWKRVHYAKLLCDRIIQDEYWKESIIFKRTGRKGFEHEEYMIKQDISQLADTLQRYLRSWWD